MKYQNVNVKGVNFPKTQLGKTKMDTICNVALNLFATKNFYATSISDICKAAKMAVGTFYIYFEDKVALYNFLLFNYQLDIFSTLRVALKEKNCTTRKEKEREGIRAFIEYVYKQPTLYTIIWGSICVDFKSFSDYYTSFAQSYRKGLERDKDELDESIDTLDMAYTLMGITNFIGLKMIFEKDMTKDKLDKLMDDTLYMMENGMFAKNLQ